MNNTASYVRSNDEMRICYYEESAVRGISLPERFTFPFYYEPHPLARLAAAELQHYLENEVDLDHNFGLTAGAERGAIGKMFGVLVVRDADGRIGYLCGVSGKLAGTNYHAKLVPPVFDMLTESSFFLKEQEVIDGINRQIELLETDEGYNGLKLETEALSSQSVAETETFKQQLKNNKELRRQRREANRNNPDQEAAGALETELARESNYDRHRLAVLKAAWTARLDEARMKLAPMEARLEGLKSERKERSARLQEQLFEQYTFLNKVGKTKSLRAIFGETAFGRPPAGAGECATPKLLHYAFANGYEPLAMAEFWWGRSPSSDIRQHKQYYPACAGKCKPILAHMLEGMSMDENPFLQREEERGRLEIIYEDEHLLVVNKPAGLRSVPGVDIADSVYSRLRLTLADAEPFMVHRLDMGTSGLLVVAKTAEVHKHIQQQFLDRKVRKRYTALLCRVIAGDEGEIDLPLCPDPFNRPRQMVCFATGKKSITRWKVVDRTGDKTRIHFWPLTGRTHQLRMHAAHELGLNAPIAGDDIYGTADKRLYLHAAEISFVHPKTRAQMSFEAPEDF